MVPLSVYDVPRTIAEQFLDDELTMTGVRKTIFSPDQLTIQERSGFSQRLKESLGGHAITDTVVDIATNPWVWAAVLLSPGYGRKFDKFIEAGKSPFSGRVSLGANVRQDPLFLGAIGGLTGHQILNRTHLGSVIEAAGEAKKAALDEWGRALGVDTKKLADFHGIKHGESLDYTQIPDPAKREMVAETTTLMENWLAGRWKDHRPLAPGGQWRYVELDRHGNIARDLAPEEYVKLHRVRAGLIEQGKKPDFSLDKMVAQVDLLPIQERLKGGKGVQDRVNYKVATQEFMEAELKKRGAWELTQKLKEKQLELLKKNIGMDGIDEFYEDPEKIFKHFTAIDRKGSKFAWDDLEPKKLQGGDLVQALTDPRQLEALRKGWISVDQYKEMLVQAMGIHDLETYMPRNLQELWDGGSGKRFLEHDVVHTRNTKEWVLESQLTPRTDTLPAIHPEDTDRMERLYGPSIGLAQTRLDYVRRLKDWGREAQKASGIQVDGFSVHRLDGLKQMDRYADDMIQAHILHIDKPTQRELDVYARNLGTSPREDLGRTEWVNPFAFKTGGGPADFQDAPHNRRTLIEEGRRMLGDGHAAKAFDEVYSKVALGKGITRHDVTMLNWMGAKQSMEWFANSFMGDALSKWGPGKDFVDKLKMISHPDYVPGGGSGGLAHGIANLFYASHLGLNVGSVMLNLMQPFSLASTMLGPQAVLQAYPKAMKEMWGYAQERARMGLSITPDQRVALMKKHFRHFDVMGIGEKELSAIEGRLFTHETRSDSLWDKAFRLSMQGFEKSEWLNRSVAAHASEIRLLKANPGVSRDLIHEVQHRVIQETQFASDPMNTPEIFHRNPLLNNVLGRQFLSFMARSFTGMTHVAPLMLERSWASGFADTALRSMGTGAVVYEIGKNMLGADLSRGLPFSSATALAGGSNFFSEDKAYIPLPPAIEVPINMVRAAASGDMDLWSRTLPRLIPGGVALSRALGVLPQTPLALGMQRTYADYNNRTPDGKVPIYKVEDGSLVDYRDPSEMILRGLGADLGKWQQPGELDHYLTNMRDESTGYRQQFLLALKNGDSSKAQSVRAEYQKRFKIPLTVTQQQVKDSIRLGEVGRTERILGRLPSDIRELYTQVAEREGRGAAMGLPEGALSGNPSSRSRDPLRPHPISIDLEQLEELQQPNG